MSILAASQNTGSDEQKSTQAFFTKALTFRPDKKRSLVHLLCLGKSFTGRYLASRFSECQVSFVSRDPSALKKEGLRAAGPRDRFDAVLDTVPAIPASTKPGSCALDLPYAELLRRHGWTGLRYIHISSTSVLGRSDARASRMEDLPRLDETAEASPQNKRAELRLSLERLIRSTYPEALILRAAGIYGPGRNLPLSLLAEDTRRSRSPELVVNRIHVQDLCRLILAAASSPDFPKLIHAADEHPASHYEVFSWLFAEFPELANVLKNAGYVPEAPPRGLVGKVIRSRYLSSVLGKLDFPDYRAGFRHCLQEDGLPGRGSVRDPSTFRVPESGR